MNVADKSFEKEAKFRCLGMTVTNQNCIHKEIKSILNLGIDGTMHFKIFIFLAAT
jgi:hypothetical protein